MMSFKPTEEQELARETMASFAREVLRPRAREADETGQVAPEIVVRGWELGLVQSTIPEANGGYGDARSAVTSALLLEELAYGDLALALHLLTPRLFTIPLVVAGTPAQRAAWLPRFTTAEFTVGTAAFVEPDWAFDPTALATRAEPAGGDWILHGVRVPGAARLGEGAPIAPLFDASRVALAALAVGLSRAAFEYARDYAKERRAFGQAIAQKQAIAFKLADMAIEIDAMRLLAWEAAWRIDRGLPATREAVLAKDYAARAALKIADDAVQILGGHGYIRDHPVELWLRNARGFATFDGLAIA